MKFFLFLGNTFSLIKIRSEKDVEVLFCSSRSGRLYYIQQWNNQQYSTPNQFGSKVGGKTLLCPLRPKAEKKPQISFFLSFKLAGRKRNYPSFLKGLILEGCSLKQTRWNWRVEYWKTVFSIFLDWGDCFLSLCPPSLTALAKSMGHCWIYCQND